MSGGRTWGSVIGAIAGYFVPGLGWAAGAALGGAVGGLLEPTKHTESGRIDDLKVSVSQYGSGIPEIYGNDVPPATWVWATDIIEMGEEQSAGKGGGVENTNYRQFLHGYLVLGRTPPPGSTVRIRKAWMDGKLTYDSSFGISTAQALATEENPHATISVHPGFEDQLPIPIIEFYEGIGNVPAYRGCIGIFVFGLECPGGRVPQISFEVCIDAAVQTVKSTFASVDAPTNGAYGVIRSDAAWHYRSRGNDYDGTLALDVTYLGPGYATKKATIPSSSIHSTSAFIPISGDGPASAIRLRRAVDNSLSSTHYLDVFNLEEGVYTSVLVYVPGTSAKVISPQAAGYESSTGKFVVRGGGSDYTFNAAIIDGGSVLRTAAIPGEPGPVAIKDDQVYALSASGGRLVLSVFDGESGVLVASHLGPAFADSSMYWAALHPGDDGLYVWVRNSPKYNLYIVGPSSGIWTLISDNVNTTPTEKVGDFASTIYADTRRALIGPSSETGGKHNYTYHRFNVVVPNEVDVASIIDRQSRDVGLTPDRFDLTAIDDQVWGYTFNKSPSSARSNLAPLLTYGAIAVVEEDGLIRYFHRGDRPIGELITWEELGCVEAGQEPSDPFPLTRTQAAELPRSVTVSYINPSFDYQTSTETAQRIVTESQLDEQVSLPIAMSANAAATIAHRILMERWTAQNMRTSKTSRKFAMLSPGDVRPIEYPKGTVGNYMAVKVTDTGALIEADWMPADAELLTQTVPGSNGAAGQQIAPLTPPTQLTVLDTAILRDADNNAGVYAALAGFGLGWLGGVLWAGDDEQSLQERGSVFQGAPQGPCESILAGYSLGNVDEHNLLTVSVVGELTSITRDVLLNGMVNVAAVGAAGRWEIIKFQRADSLGSGRYLLSGLLRGLRGTEWAAGTHQTGDRFVLLSGGGVLRPVYDGGAIGSSKAYRAVSVGRRFDAAYSQYAANTGEALRPLSPTTLRKTFSTNDIVLTPRRRTRLSEQWWLGNVPLGEESEKFEVDIFADGTFATVKRTLAATGSTVTYTSAQQVADFGSNQTIVHVRVYQMSGTVGRGHELQMSI